MISKWPILMELCYQKVKWDLRVALSCCSELNDA
jgi:hypothetical protein